MFNTEKYRLIAFTAVILLISYLFGHFITGIGYIIIAGLSFFFLYYLFAHNHPTYDSIILLLVFFIPIIAFILTEAILLSIIFLFFTIVSLILADIKYHKLKKKQPLPKLMWDYMNASFFALLISSLLFHIWPSLLPGGYTTSLLLFLSLIPIIFIFFLSFRYFSRLFIFNESNIHIPLKYSVQATIIFVIIGMSLVTVFDAHFTGQLYSTTQVFLEYYSPLNYEIPESDLIILQEIENQNMQLQKNKLAIQSISFPRTFFGRWAGVISGSFYNSMNDWFKLYLQITFDGRRLETATSIISTHLSSIQALNQTTLDASIMNSTLTISQLEQKPEPQRYSGLAPLIPSGSSIPIENAFYKLLQHHKIGEVLNIVENIGTEKRRYEQLNMLKKNLGISESKQSKALRLKLIEEELTQIKK